MRRLLAPFAAMTMMCALANAPLANAALPPLTFAMHLDAPATAVWDKWTTEAGAKSFFGPEVNIEPRVDGAYEIFFSPQNPAGMRGAENLRIVAFEAPHRLMFTWSSPPMFPAARQQRAIVEIRLSEDSRGGTNLTLSHFAFGDGPEWEGTWEYFDNAWIVVLARLERSLRGVSIDWKQEYSRTEQERASEAANIRKLHREVI